MSAADFSDSKLFRNRELFHEPIPGKPGAYRPKKEPLLPELRPRLYNDEGDGWTLHYPLIR
jgi:hypothetical protein